MCFLVIFSFTCMDIDYYIMRHENSLSSADEMKIQCTEIMPAPPLADKNKIVLCNS